MPCNSRKWETKTGQLMRLHEMEDSHLLNTYRFMIRRLSDVEDHEDFAMSEFEESTFHGLRYEAEEWLSLLEDEVERRCLHLPDIFTVGGTTLPSGGF